MRGEEASRGRDSHKRETRSSRRDFLGAPIDSLTMAETLGLAEEAMQHRQLLHHVCLNVAKFVAMRSDPVLDADIRASDVVSVDGMGIFWAARLLGIPVSERVAGVDLFQALLALCAEHGFRPFFLGARVDVLEQALGRLRERHPTLRIAGWHHGYFSAAEEPAIVATIRQSQADCLFIAMPTPHKERFLNAYRESLGTSFIMGIGGSIDIIAGKARRAPRAVQMAGLEWAWRMLLEPRRLAPRYLKTNFAFAGLLLRACWSRCAKGLRREIHDTFTG